MLKKEGEAWGGKKVSREGFLEQGEGEGYTERQKSVVRPPRRYHMSQQKPILITFHKSTFGSLCFFYLFFSMRTTNQIIIFFLNGNLLEVEESIGRYRN